MNWRALVLFVPLLSWPAVAASAPPPEIDQAFTRMYNFDFAGSRVVLDAYITGRPREPLPYAVRSATYLFSELDRLGILESEFFSDDRQIVAKKKLRPDPVVRQRLLAALDDARGRADTVLAADPRDRQALFAMCIASGIATDYTALVEKRQIASLSYVRSSNEWARRLLDVDPRFYDAYLSTGLTEYIIGSLPFFVRWFVRVDQVQGSKEKGIRNVELVARQGHYFKPFAKILLGIAYLRAKRPRDTQRMLSELARDYPANPLIQKELAKINAQVR